MSSETHEPLTEKANAAFVQSVARVIEQARRTGTPVIVWEQGLVKAYSVEDLERRATAASQSGVPRASESATEAAGP